MATVNSSSPPVQPGMTGTFDHSGAPLRKVLARRVPPLTLALTSALAAVLLPLAPPTEAMGAWGWVAAAFLIAFSAAGALGLRASGPRPAGQLLLIGYLGLGQLALLEWLSGGDPSPYRNLILVWILYAAILQGTRRLVVFLVVVAAALKLSLLYSGLDPLVFGEDAALFLVGVVLAMAAARVVDAVSAARSSEAYLAAIVASSDDAVMAATPDGLISSWNAGAEKLFGYSPEEVIGKPTAVLIPPAERRRSGCPARSWPEMGSPSSTPRGSPRTVR